jgi:hypothetical protein
MKHFHIILLIGLFISTIACQKKSNINESLSGCYVYEADGNKVFLKINIKDQTASGEIAHEFVGKDSNTGTFEGTFYGDTLIANRTFMSEGQESKDQIALLFTNNGFLEGYGEVNPLNGLPDLSKRDLIYFNENWVLKKTECK